jgi:hypothetical protein
VVGSVPLPCGDGLRWVNQLVMGVFREAKLFCGMGGMGRLPDFWGYTIAGQ